MTLYCAELSAMSFDCSISNYHSNKNCHTKVVHVPRAIDKVLPVNIYSNHRLLTLLIELLKFFSISTSGRDGHCFVFHLFIRECPLHSDKTVVLIVMDQNGRKGIT